MTKLDKFYSFVIDEIGFSLKSESNSLIYLRYGENDPVLGDEWEIVIAITNVGILTRDIRYSLMYYSDTLSINRNQRNFDLSDLRPLEIFRDDIRDNKLKKLGI